MPENEEIKDLLQKLVQQVKQLRDTKSELPRLLTTEEAAAFLGCAPQTLSLWRSQGVSMPYIKVERCVRYQREDLEKYVQQQRVSN